MKLVSTVQFKPGSREELLPDFDPAFPCISTCYGLREEGAPWHWHRAAELFYMESGTLEYFTPSERLRFTAGCGGLVNSGVLHMTRGLDVRPGDRQLIHLFEPELISGGQGSRIEERYVLPLTTDAGTEIVLLSPEREEYARALGLLRESFLLSPEEPGYELRLRAMLSEIWLEILAIAAPSPEREGRQAQVSGQIKLMMAYVHEHFPERITAADIAKAACISERAAFELFRKYLRTSPMRYVTEHRLRMAAGLLASTDEPVTAVAAACGLGSSSYFAKLFRQETGLSPLEFRARKRAEGREKK